MINKSVDTMVLRQKCSTDGAAPVVGKGLNAADCIYSALNDGRTRKLFRRLRFHLWSIFLFTYTDLKTIVGPSSLFGLMNAFALSIYSSSSRNPPAADFSLPPPTQILAQTPTLIFWVWLNLLPFAIDNQRQPDAIIEDALNKPWRTLPTGRLSPQAAKYLMLSSYSLAIILSIWLGNWPQCLALIVLGVWYNDLRGGDSSCLVRNLINAWGYTCFSSGAMQVAIGGRDGPSALRLLGWWYAVLACVIFSTVHAQDMYDQRGDAVKNRKTVPLVIGDVKARWTIAVMMVFWSVMAPLCWKTPLIGYAVCLWLGLLVARRTLKYRDEKADKKTFRIWNAWIAAIYFLPLLQAMQSGGSAAPPMEAVIYWGPLRHLSIL